MAQEEGKGSGATYRRASKRPEWLVMVYLAGDNNLSANSIAVMQELEEALDDCDSDDVRVVACFDPNTPRPSGARYVEIKYRRKKYPNSQLDWALHDDLVPFEDLPDHPVRAPDFCGDNPAPHRPSTEPVAREGLSRFIKFALRRHRADRHMLILYGHGSAVAGNTFLADNNPPSFLRLTEFREVLSRYFDADERPAGLSPAEEEKRKPPLDILACDNCMMNGIEYAYELRRQVKYTIGSQGLVLALGWPFRKIITQLVRNKNASTKRIAERILRLCARNLIDFSLMDRSSEQSLCDLTTLGHRTNVVTAVRGLSAALQEGLAYDSCGKVKHPAVRDAVRLARLEAQSYWSETFVDLYDFCALLLERSTDALTQLYELFNRFLQTRLAALNEKAARPDKDSAIDLRPFSPIKEFGDIARACWNVLEAIRANQEESGRRKRPFVLASYYVGPELQYSNGVSIYFPWTLPEDPIIFESAPGGGGSRYGLSWSGLDRAQQLMAKRLAAGEADPPQDVQFITAFDEYAGYEFAKCDGGDWAAFLTAFFKATLRDVRRFDLRYQPVDEVDRLFVAASITEGSPFLPDRSDVDLQKSSSDKDSETDCVCPTIKNYPRRFYLSPADCLRRCLPSPRRDQECPPEPDEQDKELCVSYLGWNVRGFVAEAIKLKGPRPKSSGAADNGLDAGQEGESGGT